MTDPTDVEQAKRDATMLAEFLSTVELEGVVSRHVAHGCATAICLLLASHDRLTREVERLRGHGYLRAEIERLKKIINELE